MEYKRVKIQGHERYEIDTNGIIYGLKGQPLKYWKRGKGYYCCQLNGKTVSPHRLAAIAFLGLSEEFDGRVVDHINEDKLDNRVENLQVLTNSENVRKSLGGDMSLPKGVSRLKSTGLYKYTIYTDKKYPKGKIVKSSKDLDTLLQYIQQYNG
mgnify:CR=1 FL=1